MQDFDRGSFYFVFPLLPSLVKLGIGPRPRRIQKDRFGFLLRSSHKSISGLDCNDNDELQHTIRQQVLWWFHGVWVGVWELMQRWRHPIRFHLPNHIASYGSSGVFKIRGELWKIRHPRLAWQGIQRVPSHAQASQAFRPDPKSRVGSEDQRMEAWTGSHRSDHWWRWQRRGSCCRIPPGNKEAIQETHFPRKGKEVKEK